MRSVIIGHIIRDRQDTFFNLLDNFNVGLTLSMAYMFTFFAVLSVSILLHELTHRVRFGRRRNARFSKRIEWTLSKFRNKKPLFSVIGIFVLFVSLFIWVNQLFLINNIKVSYFEGNTLTNQHRIHPPLNLLTPLTS